MPALWKMKEERDSDSCVKSTTCLFLLPFLSGIKDQPAHTQVRRVLVAELTTLQSHNHVKKELRDPMLTRRLTFWMGKEITDLYWPRSASSAASHEWGGWYVKTSTVEDAPEVLRCVSHTISSATCPYKTGALMSMRIGPIWDTSCKTRLHGGFQMKRECKNNSISLRRPGI